MRLAALSTHPIPYQAPLYRFLSQEPGLDLTVFFCSRQGVDDRFVDPEFGQHVAWKTPLLDGYRHSFLPPALSDRGARGFFSLINPSIVGELRRGRYDALWLHGYLHATHWLAFAAAVARGIPVLVRGEANLMAPRSRFRRATRAAVLRRLFNAAAGCLYIGSRNREYYEHYGVPAAKLFFAPYSVDNASFRSQAESLLPRRAALKTAMGIPEDLPVVLFVGKLIPKKQPVRLLQAFRRAYAETPCALLLVGSGSLEGQLRQIVRSQQIQHVYMTGFMNQDDIAQAYALADVFVLPSRSHAGEAETWGLTVNEAMNFGLPTVVTDAVGCAGDLVRSGETGYVIPPDSTDALAAALTTLVANADLRRRMGRHAREVVSAWGVDATAQGILAAAQQVTSAATTRVCR